jgi:ankyrin repeat protein
MAKDSASGTPLHVAAIHGQLACVTHLLGRPDNPKMTPAEVDTLTADGWTSLHNAASNGHERVCAALIKAGASLTAAPLNNVTPLQIARHYHPGNAEGKWTRERNSS